VRQVNSAASAGPGCGIGENEADAINVSVIGAGQVGHGIARVFASPGYSVVLTDANEAVLSQAYSRLDHLPGVFAKPAGTASPSRQSGKKIDYPIADFEFLNVLTFYLLLQILQLRPSE